jgi:hypothetical protein
LGFEHFKQYDFLRDKEVVLTFDDGPWPVSAPAPPDALLRFASAKCPSNILTVHRQFDRMPPSCHQTSQ